MYMLYDENSRSAAEEELSERLIEEDLDYEGRSLRDFIKEYHRIVIRDATDLNGMYDPESHDQHVRLSAEFAAEAMEVYLAAFRRSPKTFQRLLEVAGVSPGGVASAEPTEHV